MSKIVEKKEPRILDAVTTLYDENRQPIILAMKVEDSGKVHRGGRDRVDSSEEERKRGLQREVNIKHFFVLTLSRLLFGFWQSLYFRIKFDSSSAIMFLEIHNKILKILTKCCWYCFRLILNWSERKRGFGSVNGSVNKR